MRVGARNRKEKFEVAYFRPLSPLFPSTLVQTRDSRVVVTPAKIGSLLCHSNFSFLGILIRYFNIDVNAILGIENPIFPLMA